MIENDKALEVQRIAEQYNGIDYRSFEYDGLPPAVGPSPLLRIPEQTALTEKIGNTEYTLNALFREDGRDLLGYLSNCFSRTAWSQISITIRNKV